MSSSFPTIKTPRGDTLEDAPRWNPQRASGMASHRYRDIYSRTTIPSATREWPNARLSEAPLWVPVDLRDGNQALAQPMDTNRKLRFFELMVAMGFKEIEVGYPSASQADFDFVRLLSEVGRIPHDVTIVVFTPARRDLIERTVDSIRGVDRAVVHMYTATAPTWRDVVLRKTRDEVLQMVSVGAADIARLTHEMPGVRYEFSPEVFILTELDFVLELSDRVGQIWDATPQRPMILNLPSTVEVSTPNVFADQIEYVHRNLDNRDAVILSVHPHNDRGTGVASAELGLLAGAQRIEGCLFGNGERTGNVDLVTLALNLHAQGVDPMIDFSDIDEVRRTVEHCNRIPVHDRHPYAGDLVYTAYSGTHQDAIKKGFAHHRTRAAELGLAPSSAPWDVPYLPIDPADVGRSYEAVIRVNSQSGKGGIAYVLESERGLDLPRGLQIHFAVEVQSHADESGDEVTGGALWELFESRYMTSTQHIKLLDWKHLPGPGGEDEFFAQLRIDEVETVDKKSGNGPVDALCRIMADTGHEIEVLSFAQQSVAAGSRSEAMTYLEFATPSGTDWAVVSDTSILQSTVRAVILAANKLKAAQVV